jgi:SAM-dependent methyltransferase
MLMAYYQDYLSDQPEDISKWEAMIQPVVAESADLIVSWSGSGSKKLLDIGCGYGFLLKEMKSRGWDVKGLEVSKTGRDHTQSKLGFEVYSEPLENLRLSEKTFDVVTLLYVIEHVHDPPGMLTEVNRILKPGGFVFARWPHTTPIVRILGPLSQKLDLYHTPYHLYDFSPQTIEVILSKTGFKSVKTMIGSHTLPCGRGARWFSMVFGKFAKILFVLSNGKILLPGVSKTTIALK